MKDFDWFLIQNNCVDDYNLKAFQRCTIPKGWFCIVCFFPSNDCTLGKSMKFFSRIA